MSKVTRKICITGMGIALYVVLSMTAKIPVIGHISLDLGYVALAVFCLYYGGLTGAIVGGAGCVVIGMITAGWFPPGWLLGNIVIGLLCGYFYDREGDAKAFVANTIITILAVAIGILVIKTAVECALYAIPVAVKLPKNLVAAAMDAGVMVFGLVVAQMIKIRPAIQ